MENDWRQTVIRYAGMLYRNYGVWHTETHITDWIELLDGVMTADEFKKYVMMAIRSGDKMPTCSDIIRMRDNDAAKKHKISTKWKPDRLNPQEAKRIIAEMVDDLSSQIAQNVIAGQDIDVEWPETPKNTPPRKRDTSGVTTVLIEPKNGTTTRLRGSNE